MLFGLFCSRRPLVLSVVILAALLSGVPGLEAQSAPAGATATAPSAARQIGTVKRIEASTLTLTTDAGQDVAVDEPATARVLQLAPGSKDLKSAQPGSFADIAVGDRVLATGSANGAGFSALRVILMRSADIDQKRQAETADWQRRGSGGLVSAVDPATGMITVTSGLRKTEVSTNDKTIFRRYAGDSVRIEDAKLGTLAEIHVGDQIRVRGTRTEAGQEQAEEVVSGSFRNVSGTLLSVDATGSTISLKDLTTKRNVSVKLTPNTGIHMLSPEQAAGFAARQRAAASPNGSPDGSQGGARVGGSVGGAGRAGAGTAGASADAAAGGGGSGVGQAGSARAGGGRSAGGDLSQMVARLPVLPVSSLHTGDAVMIVASQASPADPMTAITVLSGVGPILAAAPSGSAGMELSPWSVGGGAPEAAAQ